MTLTIKSPNELEGELRYICKWLFNEVFGQKIQLIFGSQLNDIEIRCEGHDKVVFLDCSFVEQTKNAWLSTDSLNSYSEVYLSEEYQNVTCIYGSRLANGKWLEVAERQIKCGIDILGSLFFLISRYEEAIEGNRDNHGRFASNHSVVPQEVFRNRAVGNELIELLWHLLIQSFPGLERKQRKFRVLPSHDVDFPSYYARFNRRLIMRKTGRLLWRGNISQGAKFAMGWAKYYFTRGVCDPFETIDRLMDVSEQAGAISSFYYIPEKTSPLDGLTPIDHPAVVRQWKRIAARGHEIGIHPGYESCERPECIIRGAETIRGQLEELGIQQSLLGGRQHYLRWKTPETARYWDAAGLDYDSTLGYADLSGFRCGVCYEFPIYDLIERKPLKLRERPLIAMDCSVMDERYMNLGVSEKAFDYLKSLKEECRKYHGDFTLLWHNDRMADEGEARLYQEIMYA